MKRWKWIAILALPALLLLSGCIKTGYDRFVDACPEEWTKREVEAAYDAALKYLFMVKNDDGTYTIDRSKVSIDAAYAVVEGILGDLDYVLSSDGWRPLLVTMPSVRRGFEAEERRWTYIRNRLGEAKVYYDFLEMLGARITDEDREYHIQYLLPQEFDYSVDYLEAARAAGTLQEVERFITYLYTPFGERRPDPAAPDDPAAFVWVPKLQAFVIVSYAILNDAQPRQLKADYVEVWRAQLDGDTIQTESRPCARAFRKLSGSTLQVFLLDWDFEGEPGFGIPDQVTSIYARTGSELYDRYGSYFQELATCRAHEREVVRSYELPELDVQIVRAGQVGEWRGDYNADGWQVPYEYRDPDGVDWTCKLETREEGPYVYIEYVVKRWADGAVWEYWTPAEDYTGPMERVYAAGRNVTWQPKGGTQVTSSADLLIGQLYAIVYKDGDEWVKIYDADGTGLLQYMIRGVPAPGGTSAGSQAPSYEGNI